MEQVLSIFLPAWDVQLLRRRRRETATSKRPDARPLVLIAEKTRQQIVTRCCAAAQAAGVHPGMTLAEARSLCHRAQVLPFDELRSRQAMDLLAKWCLRFSPAVTVDPFPAGFHPDDLPDGLLLDVTGESHLFGNAHLLLAEVAARLGALGLSARLAIAPTLGAAWALARFGPHAMAVLNPPAEGPGSASIGLGDALAPLPVEALRLSKTLCAGLRQVGIVRVEHLLRLPRESLLVRFGEELLLRLDQAMGRADERFEPLRAGDPLEVRRLFDGPTTQLEAVMLTIQELLNQMMHALLEKESGARGVRVTLARINMPAISREVMIGRASRDGRHWWNLLRARVEAMHLGYGVEAVALTAFWTQRIRHQQLGAWDTGDAADTHDAAYEAFLDTVVNRWGSRRVLAAMPAASHVPETARQFRSVREKPAPDAETLLFADRPSLLFEEPEPAEAMALQPDHPPAWVRWRGTQRPIRSGQGPERIMTAWWDESRAASTRDYFTVQLDDGTWLWLFRELESMRWYVHGIWT